MSDAVQPTDSRHWSLAHALKQALVGLCLEGKNPPYSVPNHINGDLWNWAKTPSYEKAYHMIDTAIQRVMEGKQ